jgi:DNA-binding transcriptional LysR family regulator
MTAREERLHHCAALLAGASRDDDGELPIHDSSPISRVSMILIPSLGKAGASCGIMCPMNGTIEIGAVELFVRIAQLRSFRAAGDALGVPRSTVSRRLAELESALGTRLFHRTTRQVQLTSAGKTYFRACAPALGTIMEAGRSIAARPEDTAGRLRVTAPVTLAERLFGEVVAECLTRYPQLRLELILTDRNVDLVDEKFDLGFRAGTLKDTSVVAHELGRGQLRCFASREYLRDRGTPLTPRDLRRHECILFTPLAPRGRWTFRSRGRALEVPVQGRFIVNSIPLATETAARGLGIAQVPGGAITEGLAADQLVEVLDAYAPPTRPLYAVHASGGRVSPAARAFLEIVKTHLERIGGLGR